jgi:hypothetical protein
MIIHDNFQFHPPVVSEKKIFKNFSQSTWLPGAIKASDWSKFQSSFRESLKQIGPNLAGMFLCMVCPSGVCNDIICK